ncbi:MAG TPA: hypothetical protein VH916_00875, partial [Dehalococcoidia bacterium]
MLDRAQPLTLVRESSFLGEPLPCPLCGGALRLDSWWISPHWLCGAGHSYSNLRVLDAELREQLACTDAAST